jgi:putative endonuclease
VTAAACVYILTNKRNGTLYVGVTNNLIRRVFEHRSGEIPGFTKEHGLHRLVWFEQFTSIEEAIRREKLLKKWRREWKLNLIERDNPDWHDLHDGLV